MLRSKRDSYQTLFLLITISNSIGVQEAYGESAFQELDEILYISRHTGLICSESIQITTLTACITLKTQPLWL